MLTLENIRWSAPDGKPVLTGIDYTFPDGKLVAVTGPNGSGKTTLARIIAGLEKPLSGRILLDGADITGLNVTERAPAGRQLRVPAAGALQGYHRARPASSWLPARAIDELRSVRVSLGKVGLCAHEYVRPRGQRQLCPAARCKRIEIATVLARGTKLVWSLTSRRPASTCGASPSLIQAFQEAARRAYGRTMHHHFASGAHHATWRTRCVAAGRRPRLRTQGTRRANMLRGVLKADSCLSRPAAKRRRCSMNEHRPRSCSESDRRSARPISSGAFNIREERQVRRYAQQRKHPHRKARPTSPGTGHPHPSRTHKGETLVHPRLRDARRRQRSRSTTTFISARMRTSIIVAGCGVHTERGEPVRSHNGIHRFFLGPRRAHVKYVEKHIGTGGEGIRSIDPVTEAALEEGRRASKWTRCSSAAWTVRSAKPKRRWRRAQNCSSASASSPNTGRRRRRISAWS